MNVAVAVDGSGNVGHSWGKAARVAVAQVADGRIAAWDEYDVGWDVAHDAGTHGAHHARVVRFLKEHAVEVVLASHVGDGMVRMLNTMGVRLDLGVTGEAKQAVLHAVT
ncbi:MAG TPA: NifB/NifX family molybdenum-iron cluster-binding protein [Candidatus Nanopelagicales bacterium]|nr:NifB/NifX family molybdenum-iron cluster-binding protein [Candidatus Nanopelagicales bacterium]